MEVPGKRQEEAPRECSDDELFCQPCRSDGDWEAVAGYCQNCSEFLCSNCLKVHRKQSATRNHVILDGDDMPKFLVTFDQAEPCSEICSRHKNEIIKFYCSSHDVIGCSDCMVLDHKICVVDRIHDISNAYVNGIEHEELKRKTVEILDGVGVIKKEVTVNMNENELHGAKVIDDITTFRKVINDYLDKKESEIKIGMKRVTKQNTDKLNEISIAAEQVSGELQSIKCDLQLQKDKANEMFVKAKFHKNKIKTLGAQMANLNQRNKTKRYRFVPLFAIAELISSGASLGELINDLNTVTTRRNSSSRPNSELNPVFVNEICIKSPDDGEHCRIAGFGFISSKKMALADSENKCAKIVDICSKEMTERFPLKCSPQGLAVMNEWHVAVSLPDEKKIQVLNITPDYKFTLAHSLAINDGSTYIAYTNCKFAVAYKDPRVRVEIMTDSGQSLSVIPLTYCESVVGLAFHPDSSAIYICPWMGWGTNVNRTSVKKYNLNGLELASFTETDLDIRGIVVTLLGDVIMCNYKKIGSISILSPDFKSKTELLEGNENVTYPNKIALSDDKSLMLVYNYHDSEVEPERKNAIAVFQLK